MKAAKNGAVYNVPIEIGSNYFMAKFDTGAGVTVISSDLFLDDKSDEDSVKLKTETTNIVEPDLSIICDRNKLTDKGCTGAPDWIPRQKRFIRNGNNGTNP